MSIINKTDILDKVVNLAGLSISLFNSDDELYRKIADNLNSGHITQNQIVEIKHVIGQADARRLETYIHD